MEFISFIKRYIFGDMEGIVGKINQHLNTYLPNLDSIPKANTIISNKLLQQLDETPIAVHRGTVGIIYKSKWKNKTIAIKIVLKSTLKKLETEKSALNLLGYFKKNMSNISKEITNVITRECNMELEKKNCNILWNETNYSKFGILFLKPIQKLSTMNEFVYEYEENAVPIIDILDVISEKKIKEICKRFTLFHFDTMHNCNILLGDINITNILYDQDKDKIIIIDYGCIIKMDKLQCNILKYIHNSQKNKEGIINLLEGWNCQHQLADTIYIQTRPFYETSKKEYDFSKMVIDINLFDLQLYEMEIPTKALLILRCNSQLINFLKIMKIKDIYTKDLLNLNIT